MVTNQNWSLSTSDNFMIHQDLSKKVIGGFYTVYNELGFGFLERVYQNAMMIELACAGMTVEGQKQIDVFYRGKQVGEYYADIVVNGLIIVELKAAESIVPEHEAQLINYLRGSKMELGLLFNFGPEPRFIRRILTNDRKTICVNR